MYVHMWFGRANRPTTPSYRQRAGAKEQQPYESIVSVDCRVQRDIRVQPPNQLLLEDLHRRAKRGEIVIFT